MQVEKWLSVEQISEHLGVSKETIYRWIEKNRIPVHRVGKFWRFKVSQVDAWVVNGGATSTVKVSDLHQKGEIPCHIL